MTFVDAVAELMAKHPMAKVSQSLKSGPAAARAGRIDFKKDKGGMYAGKDADGTEVLVYFNDTANVFACTEIEADHEPDDE